MRHAYWIFLILLLTGCSKDNDDAPQEAVPVAQREVLIAIYKTTGGDNWITHENWCSDKPLSEWEHVEVNSAGEVTKLDLRENNLSGTIPPEIGSLTKLQYFTLHSNPLLKGSLPKEFYHLTDLEKFSNSQTQMDGVISPEIGKLTHLNSLALQVTGSLPEEIGELENLEELALCGLIDFTLMDDEITELDRLQYLVDHAVLDGLRGKLPKAISKLKRLQTLQLYGSYLTNFEVLNQLPSLKELSIFLNPSINVFPKEITNPSIKYVAVFLTNISDFTGLKKLLNISELEIVSNPKLTEFPTACCELPQLSSLDINDNWGLSGTLPREIWNLKELTALSLGSNRLSGSIPVGISNAIKLEYFDIEQNNLTGALPSDFFRNPKLDYDNLYLNQDNGITLQPYTSTDYSMDGKIITLQQATRLGSVDIIFLGEGFLDIDMASGGYFEQKMKEAMEYFFALEPAKSYRDYFNVYAVKTISANDATKRKDTKLCFDYNKNAFNAGKAFEAAGTIQSIDLTKTLVTVVVNQLPIHFTQEYSTKYAGARSNSGERLAIATTGNSEKDFKLNVNFQAVGWGFAKLADETTSHSGSISAAELDKLKTERIQFGEGLNLSWDKSELPWEHFIGHGKYSMVNAYEGGYGYRQGIWRPEEKSVMTKDILYFNAPSRELFVKRLKELAGEAYSWEDFIAKDKYEYPSE